MRINRLLSLMKTVSSLWSKTEFLSQFILCLFIHLFPSRMVHCPVIFLYQKLSFSACLCIFCQPTLIHTASYSTIRLLCLDWKCMNVLKLVLWLIKRQITQRFWLGSGDDLHLAGTVPSEERISQYLLAGRQISSGVTSIESSFCLQFWGNSILTKFE
jgi:hypothetical protein